MVSNSKARVAASLLGCTSRNFVRGRTVQLDRAAGSWMLRAVGAAGAAIFGAAALSLVDMGAKRVAQSPPGTTALKVLTPQVAAGSLLQGAALWSSSPLVALVLRRPG